MHPPLRSDTNTCFVSDSSAFVQAMETVYSMGKEVEESVVALQNDFLGARVGAPRDMRDDTVADREGGHPDKNFFIA